MELKDIIKEKNIQQHDIIVIENINNKEKYICEFHFEDKQELHFLRSTMNLLNGIYNDKLRFGSYWFIRSSDIIRKATADESELLKKLMDDYLNCTGKFAKKCEDNEIKSAEYNLNDYDYKIEDNKLVINKKEPNYPKTFNECQEYKQKVASTLYKENEDIESKLKLQNFEKIIYCRNVYWKIAGEELGLNKSWHPSISTDGNYAIYKFNDRITVNHVFPNSKVLEFPTEKMRDNFYNNFKELIEPCKEFL